MTTAYGIAADGGARRYSSGIAGVPARECRTGGVPPPPPAAVLALVERGRASYDPALDVRLEYRILGPLEVVGEGGRLVELTAQKHRELLVRLLLERNEAIGRNALADALWGESPPASAPKLLQVYVSQLRRALGEGVLETRAPGYLLRVEPGALDVERFEQLLAEGREALARGNPALAASLLRRALALWRGPALADILYADFGASEAERLEDLRLVCLEERIAAQLALGQHADVLGELLALTREHPLRERLHELAMLALYRCGRQSEALEHYAATRAHFDAELGLEPGPALRDLQVRILRQDPELLPAPVHAPAAPALPAATGPLVGREQELAELGRLLARRDARLLVLTGAGGSGKTRLALEAARAAAGSFANGVAVVELAPLSDPALVAPTIGHALGVGEEADEPPAETLARALAARELLLVLDNAEHLRDAAPLFPQLLARAPRLTLLVTSRAVLHVSGEHVFPVSPLAEDNAVELFVQRARRLDPSFALSGENEADVREICRRVDYLPLALELAAARIRTLSPRALRERLDARLGLLTGGPRDLPARQRTLRETIAWSVDLLDEQARRVFTRLGVFPGGATLEAAEGVCGADLDALATLVDDHLVRRDDVGGEPRFAMLETIREYALELLGEARAEAELALAAYVAELVDRTEPYGPPPPDSEWLPRLDPELDNLRVALAAGSGSGDTEFFLRLAGGLWRYWWVRGSVREGVEWIERALAAGNGAPTVVRARALYGGAGLAWSCGNLERAKELARAAIPVAVDAASEWYELGARTVLGIVANDERDFVAARRHHQRSIEIKEKLGLEPLVEKLNLGVVALRSGDRANAMALFEEVLAAHRRDANAGGMGFALLNLGVARHEVGDHRESRRNFEEARACFEQIGFRAQVAYAVQGLAAAEAGEARFAEAARLLGQAHRKLEDVGQRWDEVSPEMIAWTEAEARAALGDDGFEAAFAAGRADR